VILRWLFSIYYSPEKNREAAMGGSGGGGGGGGNCIFYCAE
jgi:hypothetical protein